MTDVPKFDPSRKRIRKKVETYEEAIARGLEKPPPPYVQLYRAVRAKFPKAKPKRAGHYRLTVFTRQFATLLNAGVPLVDSFDSFVDPSDPVHVAMADVAVKVQSGQKLSHAMASMPHVFSPLYCGLVESGEKSGRLVEVLHKLADDLEKQLATQKKLMAALTYPIILIVCSILCVIWFVTVVLPMLEPMFSSMHIELPWATKVLLHSKAILVSGTLIGSILFAVSYFTYTILRRDPVALRHIHHAVLLIPIFGRLYKMVTITRVIHSLATMLDVGITIVPCLKACEGLTPNAYISYQLSEVKKQVVDGETVGQALLTVKLFPRAATSLISVGEESSNLIEMLQFSARILTEDCDMEIDTFASNIEPFIMGIMGVVVGFIVLGAMLPITQLISNL